MRLHLGVKILCGGDELDVMVLSTLKYKVSVCVQYRSQTNQQNDRVASVQHNRRDV